MGDGSIGHLALLLLAATVHAQQQAAQPWMDPGLPAEQRAHFALQAITLDGKLQLVHGTGWGVLRNGDPIAPGHNGRAGFVPKHVTSSTGGRSHSSTRGLWGQDTQGQQHQCANHRHCQSRPERPRPRRDKSSY